MKPLNISIFGLSITSCWANDHATTYRSLIRALAARGHHITFFEKDVTWYAQHRDMPVPPFCATVLYKNVDGIDQFVNHLALQDFIIVGSCVADSPVLIEKLKQLAPPCLAFYDIDTPVTLAQLERGECSYLDESHISTFDLYLSFSGGPVLETLEQRFGAQRARALYGCVDTMQYYPQTHMEKHIDLGYLGMYSTDRQPTLNELLLKTALNNPLYRFLVAGVQFPHAIYWPPNVDRTEQVADNLHRAFYCCQRFTLNVTGSDTICTGYSPSVHLFESAACGTPIISDAWAGLEDLFVIDSEILVANNSDDVRRYLKMPESQRRGIGERLRAKVLRYHTNEHRVQELENYWLEVACTPAQHFTRGIPLFDKQLITVANA